MHTLTLTDGELNALNHYLDFMIVDELNTFKDTDKEENEWWDKNDSLSLAKKTGLDKYTLSNITL